MNQGAKATMIDLLKNHDINSRDIEGRTPLHVASSGTAIHLEILQYLLSHGASINEMDNRQWTPLHYASNFQNIKSVRLLLRHNADVTASTDDGITPLHMLVKITTDINYRPNKITTKELLEVLEIVLSKGADINAADKRGNTVLHEAVTKGNKKLVSFLLKSGAKPNTLNR